MQLFFEPSRDVSKDLGFVRLHQQLVAGTGIELRLDVPDADVPEALDGPPDSGGALAYIGKNAEIFSFSKKYLLICGKIGNINVYW